MNYRFNTRCYMKHYNEDKFFILTDYVRDVIVEGDSARGALQGYAETLDNEYSITISRNAIKSRRALYGAGDKQIGYVLTGKTDFRTDTGYVSQYIDVFCTVTIETDVEEW